MRFSLEFLAVSSQFGIACWATTTPPRSLASQTTYSPPFLHSERQPEGSLQQSQAIAYRSTTIMWHHTHCPTYSVTECVLLLMCVGRGGMGLSVHAVVFGAPTLSSLVNTSHSTLPYLCASVPECAQCGPQAAVLPVMVCTYLPCSVTDLLFSDHQRLQQQTQRGTKYNLQLHVDKLRLSSHPNL